jgi:hypothetical protein
MPSTDSLFAVHKVWLRKSFAAQLAFYPRRPCVYTSCLDHAQVWVSRAQPFPKKHQRLPMIEFSPYSPPRFLLLFSFAWVKIWHEITQMSILFTDKLLDQSGFKDRIITLESPKTPVFAGSCRAGFQNDRLAIVSSTISECNNQSSE